MPFFLQRFLRLFLIVWLLRIPSFTHAVSFLVTVVVLIAASYTEIASGGACLGYFASLHGTKRGSVAHGYFEGKSNHWVPENQALVRLKLPMFSDVLQAKFHLTIHNKTLNFFCQYSSIFILCCEYLFDKLSKLTHHSTSLNVASVASGYRSSIKIDCITTLVRSLSHVPCQAVLGDSVAAAEKTR